MLSREIFTQSFIVGLSKSQVTITKKCIHVNSLTSKELNCYDIDTDIPSQYRNELQSILEKFSAYFATKMPKTRVKIGELQVRLIDRNNNSTETTVQTDSRRT